MRILFFSHDATRTGAPTLLLRLVQLLVAQGNSYVEVFFKYGGEMKEAFEAICPVAIVPPYAGADKKHFFARKSPKEKQFEETVKKIQSFDIIISNTITNGDLDDYLRLHPKVYTYVHELENSVNLYTTPYFVQKVIEHTKKFLVPTQVIKTYLVQKLKIDEKNIALLPSYVPDQYDAASKARASVRAQYGIKENETLILGIGGGVWTKGPDLFLQSILYARLQNNTVKGMWAGLAQNGTEDTRMAHDVSLAGLKEHITLLPKVDNPFELLAACDIFFMSSREESYSLVVLEAAMMKKAILYFEGVGGPDEFVEADFGVKIPYYRTDMAAEAICQLASSAEKRATMGKRAREKYTHTHAATNVWNAFTAVIK